MPVVTVNRERLFAALGRSYTEDEFQDLCFQYGLELDAVTSEREMIEAEQGKDSDAAKHASSDVLFKIEVAANRYDLLCEEGLVRALKIFQQQGVAPQYAIRNTQKALIEMTVSQDTQRIRPFIVCAVLRNVRFTAASFDSFIELQEKLHQNICRKRTLVAIGTHDLDTLTPPFRYEARTPQSIKFRPLEQAQEFTADKLLEFYETNAKVKHIKPYVGIIKSSDVYPVIYDANNVVLSLPPIINGDHSKISLNTTNVFIEATATDLTKAHIVVSDIVSMFSQYCAEPFTFEEVKVTYPDGTVQVTPNMSSREMTVDLEYINSRIGATMTCKDVAQYLTRMQHVVTSYDDKKLVVRVPPTRSDILHPCDLMEDTAVAYGFNNLKKTTPKTSTVGKQDPLNRLSDMLRLELAMYGYTEALNLILCSHEENFKMLNRVDDGETCAKMSNPKTVEFQVCRTNLIAGLLKTTATNLKFGIPLQMFEVSDVVLKDKEKDVGARNCRRLALSYCGKTSGLEFVHGMLDRVMEVLDVPFNDPQGYTISPSNDPTFFPGRQAHVLLKGKKIGIFGVIQPDVLKNFDIVKFPMSVLELDIEPFL